MKVTYNISGNRLNGLIRKSSTIAAHQLEMTMSFQTTLKGFMKDKRVGRDDLAYDSGLSESTIHRMRNDKNYCPTKQMVIAVCVSLGLTPAEAWALFKRTDLGLKMTDPQDVAYFHILCTCGEYSREEINAELTSYGYETIGK